jgi:CspA family cold shock protein
MTATLGWRFLNHSEGFGFIEAETGRDVFVHFSATHDSGYKSLQEGQAVRFNVQNGHKGNSPAKVNAA